MLSGNKASRESPAGSRKVSLRLLFLTRIHSVNLFIFHLNTYLSFFFLLPSQLCASDPIQVASIFSIVGPDGCRLTEDSIVFWKSHRFIHKLKFDQLRQCIAERTYYVNIFRLFLPPSYPSLRVRFKLPPPALHSQVLRSVISRVRETFTFRIQHATDCREINN